MIEIKIKPLSVNRVWQGRRFKTQEYKDYEQSIGYVLPKLKIPEGKLLLEYVFGLSSKNCDIDNPIKPFTDILQKHYNFNDKQIYKMVSEKVDVKKGEEFVRFNITHI